VAVTVTVFVCVTVFVGVAEDVRVTVSVAENTGVTVAVSVKVFSAVEDCVMLQVIVWVIVAVAE
jgi:hypothetical protein